MLRKTAGLISGEIVKDLEIEIDSVGELRVGKEGLKGKM